MSSIQIAGAVAGSFVVGLLLLPILIKLSHRLQLLDLPGKHKRHARPVPFTGGLALFLSTWLTVAGALLFWPHVLGGAEPLLPYILGGAVIIFAIGFIDDMHPVSAWVKLTAEATAGIVLFAGGLTIDPISIPFYGQVSIGSASLLLSVLWVVGLSNS